jgi:hypothetical protein
MSTQALNACWYGALVADLMGAVLSFLCCRWFAMLNPSEAEEFQRCCSALEAAKPIEPETIESQTSLIDRMISWGIYMAEKVVWMGFMLFVAGLLVMVWSKHQLAEAVFVTVVFVGFGVFIPCFMLHHGRRAVIHRLRIKRRSGNS